MPRRTRSDSTRRGDWASWEDYPERSSPIPADGIKAQTRAGTAFGQTWWGGKWIAALERLVNPGRLQRGRSYARKGQVLNIDFSGNRIESRVQGTRKDPYQISMEIKSIDDKRWSQIIDAMASQAIFAAKLLAGEMPQNIEEAFSAAGAALFPERTADLKTECSCPDYANPCKHISAVYYLLGERFDADPFLLFQLRGKSRGELIADLRARRGTAAGDRGVNEIRAPAKTENRSEVHSSKSRISMPESGQQNALQPAARTSKSRARASKRDVNALGKQHLSADEEAVSLAEMGSPSIEEPDLPLDEALDRFWDPSHDVESMDFTIARPEVDAAPVKRLGQPPFWSSKLDFIAEMESIYRAISEAAIKTALGE